MQAWYLTKAFDSPLAPRHEEEIRSSSSREKRGFMSGSVVIVSRARTPIGSFQGGLSSFTAPELGSLAIKAALERAEVETSQVDEVIMGEVLPAGVGQAPARQASLGAGLLACVPCTTVNKVCGSGMKALMMARQSILLGDSKIVVAGGMESMSKAPYLLPTARKGMRMGNQEVVDSIIHDGLWDHYGKAHMGHFGDLCATRYEFSRQAQDDFAKASYERAILATQKGWFKDEITPTSLEDDEEPKRYVAEKMSTLKPAFSPTGTVTAANASKLNDGAAALVLMDEKEARRREQKPLARILSTATFAQDPAWFTTAPVGAIQSVIHKTGISLAQIDLFEINEAFSVVPMAVMRELQIPHERVNVWGGAVSLGHPIGCSGARIVGTLISAMRHQNAKIGCAAICLGGGEAVAILIQCDA